MDKEILKTTLCEPCFLEQLLGQIECKVLQEITQAVFNDDLKLYYLL